MARFPSRLAIVIPLLALTIFGALDTRAETLVGIDNSGNLYKISQSDASLTLIGPTHISSVASLETAPDGTLYAVSSDARALYRINPTNAVATLVGPLNLPGFISEGALAFSPAGVAYGAAVYGDAVGGRFLFTINLATGAATIGGPLDNSAFDINGMIWRSDGIARRHRKDFE